MYVNIVFKQRLRAASKKAILKNTLYLNIPYIEQKLANKIA